MPANFTLQHLMPGYRMFPGEAFDPLVDQVNYLTQAYQTPISGTAYWVDSATGNDSTGNGTFDAPWATINFAVTQITANNDDVIFCKPTHTETIIAAAGCLLSKSNCRIQGLGNGRGLPTIRFETSTAATLRITGAYVQISGFELRCNIAALVTMIDVRAKGVVISDNIFAGGSAVGAGSMVGVAGAANAADSLTVQNNVFLAGTTNGYTTAIAIDVVEDNVQILNNYIHGSFSLGGISNITGQVATNMVIAGNYVRNTRSGKGAVLMVSAVTGSCFNNNFVAPSTTVPTGLFGSLVMAGQNVGLNGNLDAGEEFWYSALAIVSSTIVTAGVDISALALGGDLAIVDVILKTNGTGLAGGTNLQVISNNANGAALILAESVANLGANKTVNMATASVTPNGRTILEQGKKLQLKATGADCTGAGTMDVYVRMQRLAAGARIGSVTL